LKPVLNLRMTI